jgi:pyruvate kinase
VRSLRRRKTKVICTMGPKCWSEDIIGQLLDAGMNMARFNFSHGDHGGHGGVLERVRKVCAAKQVLCATMLDTKGPEIRTAMLRDHQAIQLEANQEIIVQAVGDDYVNFEGYKTPTETRIGLSYAGLCRSIAPGKRILLADGTISIEVLEILNETELRGRVMNTQKLGERKNCNLPGVKVDIPVLTVKDIDDLQNFGCKLGVDFIAASFVQSADDVKFIRRVLDEAGGQSIRIISKIENQAGLNNFDEILKYTDGVMVARGDLGMEIPSWKVPQAQKMLITKCNVAGKFVITATQMLESMIGNPLPTRAEMTDVANAVFDGTDAVMLSGETANGDFPREAVATMAAIVENAELGVDYYSQFSFIQYWNTEGKHRTVSACESTLSSVSKMAVDFSEDTNGDGSADGVLILVLTETGAAADLVTKVRRAARAIPAANASASSLGARADDRASCAAARNSTVRRTPWW